ncbi:MAG TPA: hypothetical protein GX695_01930 [Acholeplasmataceae bacterium]|nr:hypothetical protein [Acholeplasmataceae bacterium]
MRTYLLGLIVLMTLSSCKEQANVTTVLLNNKEYTFIINNNNTIEKYFNVINTETEYGQLSSEAKINISITGSENKIRIIKWEFKTKEDAIKREKYINSSTSLKKPIIVKNKILGKVLINDIGKEQGCSNYYAFRTVSNIIYIFSLDLYSNSITDNELNTFITIIKSFNEKEVKQ